MKYQFEVDEIKGCFACPLTDNDPNEYYPTICSLGYKFELDKYRDSILPKERPVECPLVKVKEMPLEQLKELIAYGELQWDGQPFTKGMLEGLKEALKIMEGK